MAVKASRWISLPACGVFLVGLIIRWIAWANTPVINPDGALFIHQARALYYGQTDTIFCAFDHLSILPLLIAGSYWLFHDWVFAARFVSFLFGFAALVPVYLLLRCFFNDRISMLGTLIFAVLPVFVASSLDIVRDPVSWFFVALGFYWLTLGLGSRRPWLFSLSSVSLMTAAWARIEVSLIVAFSLVFLLFHAVRKKDQAFRHFVCFLMPIVGLASSAFIVVLAIKGYTGVKTLFENAPVSIFSSPYSHYRTISEKLATLAFQNRYDSLGLFLAEARQNIWLVALGSVLNRCLEAFFFIFLIVCGIGLKPAFDRFRFDERIQYFIYMTIILIIVLYLHAIRSWYVEYRHVGMLIISSAVFIGFGIDKIIQSIQNRLSFKENLITLILALIIVTLPLYKDLKPRDADKGVFKEIGEFLAGKEGTDHFISITTSCSTYRLISFYANLGYHGAPCPVESESNCWEYFSDSSDHFMENIKGGNIKYFVWNEKQWPTGADSVLDPPFSLHLKELKRWQHPDTGEMILYELF